MFTITTKFGSNASGATTVIAKGHGKQRTIRTSPSDTVLISHHKAAGALLNVLTDDRQKAMLIHPSGGQRVSSEFTSNHGGKMLFSVNV